MPPSQHRVLARYWVDHRIRDAVILTSDDDWHPAVEPGGRQRDGAEVIELTDLVDLSAWPDA